MQPQVKLAKVTLFVWLSFAIALLGCNASPADDEPLLGTWAAESGASMGQTVSFLPDGVCLEFLNDDLTEPAAEGRYAIERTWTDDADNVCYHVALKWSPPPFDESTAHPWYSALKLDSAGDLMESLESGWWDDYPVEVSSRETG